MLQSMTGYGRASAAIPGGAVVTEIRTVNHRYLDVVMRSPEELFAFEEKVRARVKKTLRRGKINIVMHIEQHEPSTEKISLNKTAAKKYVTVIQQLKRECGIKQNITIEHLLALPNIISSHPHKVSSNKLAPAVMSSLEKALTHLVGVRTNEGKSVKREFEKCATKIQKAVEKISRRMPVVVRQYKQKISGKLKDLEANGVTIEKGRLEAECAMFTKSTDISEELSRLASHLGAFRQALRTTKEAGRKLDFIAQEMARETNTICQKACDFNVSQWGIEIKGEIDKIREQAQNVE